MSCCEQWGFLMLLQGRGPTPKQAGGTGGPGEATLVKSEIAALKKRLQELEETSSSSYADSDFGSDSEPGVVDGGDGSPHHATR